MTGRNSNEVGKARITKILSCMSRLLMESLENLLDYELSVTKSGLVNFDLKANVTGRKSR